MHITDYAAQMMGIEIIQTSVGKAELRMTVRKDMLNGHGSCHGGMMFTLADTAFAHACNSTNKVTVASGCTIDFIAPAFEGDTLIAVAEERTRSGRTGIYDINLTKPDGALVAIFRGRSYQIKGQIVAEDAV
jgi:acyl-CoA thioesterase